MLDKVKIFFTILLVLILIFAVGYSIVKIIISFFQKPNIVTSDNMSEYMIEDNIVTGYSAYYYVTDCLNNYIEACNRKLYDNLYDLYIDDYKGQYTKDEIVKKLQSLEWSTVTMDMVIEYKLEKVYIAEDNYLLDITLNGEKIYLILDTQTSKDYNYKWAFVK